MPAGLVGDWRFIGDSRRYGALRRAIAAQHRSQQEVEVAKLRLPGVTAAAMPGAVVFHRLDCPRDLARKVPDGMRQRAMLREEQQEGEEAMKQRALAHGAHSTPVVKRLR
jgi:hypothetical protein